MMLYGLSGLCCGIAAIMLVAQATAGAPDHGDLYELDAIAAAIIGGTALSGGRGSIVGAILGVLIFKGITNLFIVNNLEQEYQLIVKGAIIVGAVLLQQFRVGSLRQFRKQPT
jgi:ribose transport system permease protein